MDWIIGSGLRFGRLIVALALGLTVIGIAQLRSAPVDVYPEFMPPSVEIQTEALGLSAAEGGQLITGPLEQDPLHSVSCVGRSPHSRAPNAPRDGGSGGGRPRRRHAPRGAPRRSWSSRRPRRAGSP